MEYVKDEREVERIAREIGYTWQKEYQNPESNKFYNYTIMFMEEEERIRAMTGMSVEAYLYSKLY